MYKELDFCECVDFARLAKDIMDMTGHNAKPKGMNLW
jgi:hypothetical protein